MGESPVHLGRTLFRKRVVTHCFSGFSAAAANKLFSSLHVPSLAGLQFILLYFFFFFLLHVFTPENPNIQCC